MAMRSEYPAPDPAPSAESTSTVAAPAARPRLRLVRTGITEGDRAALRHFFRDHEAECGLRSTFVDPRLARCRGGSFDSGAAHATMLALAGWSWSSRDGDDPEPNLDDVGPDGRIPIEACIPQGRVARWCGAVSFARGVRATLAEMQRAGDGAHVVVLFRLFGPGLSQGQEPVEFRRALRDTSVRGPAWSWAFPSAASEEGSLLARVADITDVAERWREEMALRVGERREEDVRVAVVRRLADGADEDEGRFWAAAGAIVALEDAITTRKTNPRTQKPVSRRLTGALERKLVLLRIEQRCWMEGALYDGEAAARTSACASADRELTAADAILDRLGTESHRAPGWKASAAELVAAAQRTKGDAERAYAAARARLR